MSIRLFFAGDFCSKPTTSFITVSDELKVLIQSCDLRVVNFEVPLKPDIDLPPQRYERFWQHDDVPDFLRGLGFNLLPTIMRLTGVTMGLRRQKQRWETNLLALARMTMRIK